jgi:hypothetical protein
VTIHVYSPRDCGPEPVPLAPAYQRGGTHFDTAPSDIEDTTQELIDRNTARGAIYFSDEPEADMGFKVPKQVITLSSGDRFEIEEHLGGALTIRSLDGSLRLEPVMGNRIDLLVI